MAAMASVPSGVAIPACCTASRNCLARLRRTPPSDHRLHKLGEAANCAPWIRSNGFRIALTPQLFAARSSGRRTAGKDEYACANKVSDGDPGSLQLADLGGGFGFDFIVRQAAQHRESPKPADALAEAGIAGAVTAAVQQSCGPACEEQGSAVHQDDVASYSQSRRDRPRLTAW